MPNNQLKIVGVQISPPTQENLAGGGVQSWINLVIEVENETATLLYVWASHRGYHYDSASKVLTIHLSEQPLVLPPNIRMISDHPRAPAQVEVGAKARAKIIVRFPPVVRLPAGRGAGGGWIEEPIGEIARVEVDVQYGTTPVDRPKEHEMAAAFRSRMMAHGDVVHAKLTPSSGGESSSQKEK